MDRPLIIFDLEFTAWEGSLARNWSRSGEYREVVQFGAVRLDQETLKEVSAFETLVRPRINPELSDYFVELTGITNEAIASRGVAFEPAYRQFLAFIAGADLACFGTDGHVLDENCKLYGLTNLPAAPKAFNLWPWLEAHGVDLTGIHSGQVAGRLGLPFEGRIHDALDDARSLAMVVRHMIARGAPPPVNSGSGSGP